VIQKQRELEADPDLFGPAPSVEQLEKRRAHFEELINEIMQWNPATIKDIFPSWAGPGHELDPKSVRKQMYNLSRQKAAEKRRRGGAEAAVDGDAEGQAAGEAEGWRGSGGTEGGGPETEKVWFRADVRPKKPFQVDFEGHEADILVLTRVEKSGSTKKSKAVVRVVWARASTSGKEWVITLQQGEEGKDVCIWFAGAQELTIKVEREGGGGVKVFGNWLLHL
jgi:hypothetical protein